jgi:hypothetical protein
LSCGPARPGIPVELELLELGLVIELVLRLFMRIGDIMVIKNRDGLLGLLGLLEL